MDIRIGKIIIKDVEKNSSGIYCYKNNRKKSRIDKIKPWFFVLSSNKVLYNMVTIFKELQNNGFIPSNFELPVLRNIVIEILGCSYSSANKYAVTLHQLKCGGK